MKSLCVVCQPATVGSVSVLCAGIGGSGRQSATKLATYMADYDLFVIEISRNYTSNEWREDVKRVCYYYMQRSGLCLLSFCLSVCLSVCPSVHQFIHPSIQPFRDGWMD